MILLNKTLNAIWLDNNFISDKGIQLLSNSLINSNSSIEYIGLSNNKLINDLSFDYFINIIKFNKSINEISLYDCNLSILTKDKIKNASKLRTNFIIYLNTWNE